MLFSMILDYFKKHVKDYLTLYTVVSCGFLIGIFIGAFTVNELNMHQERELVSYLKGFFSFLRSTEIENLSIFSQSIINNTQIMLLIYFLGISVIGAPLVLIILAFEGFTIGFTVGLLAKELAGFGVLISFFAVLPHVIINVTVLIIASVFALSFTIEIILKKANKIKNNKFANQLITYSFVQICLTCILVVASVFEAFVAPFVMTLILRFI